MKRTSSLSVLLAASSLSLLMCASAGTAASLANRGNDPFLHVSSAIAPCPTPRGPFQTQQEWLDDAHYRIERSNSYWIAGRCRLSNSYDYERKSPKASCGG